MQFIIGKNLEARKFWESQTTTQKWTLNSNQITACSSSSRELEIGLLHVWARDGQLASSMTKQCSDLHLQTIHQCPPAIKRKCLDSAESRSFFTAVKKKKRINDFQMDAIIEDRQGVGRHYTLMFNRKAEEDSGWEALNAGNAGMLCTKYPSQATASAEASPSQTPQSASITLTWEKIVWKEAAILFYF